MWFTVVIGSADTEASEQPNKRSFYDLKQDTKGGFYA